MGPDGEMQHISDDSANLTSAPTTVKVTLADLLGLLTEARSVVIRGDEIVQGTLPKDADAQHPEVQRILTGWGATHFLHQRNGRTEVTLVRRAAPFPRERWWLHLLLGLATLLTTTIAGGYFLNRAPLDLRWLDLGPVWIPLPTGINPGEIPAGLIFSVPLMAILFAHEMGHYLVARRHGMNVSPPYFIPAPNWINFIGTFGAFIRLRSVVVNRRVLLDVGAGGPIASFLLSVSLIAAGLRLSAPLPGAPFDPASPYLVGFAGQQIWLGDSLLFGVLRDLVVPAEGTLLLHPLAFAGWLGLFVTALNLVPLAQLDGGHILYALLRDRQRWVGAAFLVLLAYLGQHWWGWWLWMVLILVIGRGTIRHPSVFDPEASIGVRRQVVGWICVAIFIVTFIPIPLRA